MWIFDKTTIKTNILEQDLKSLYKNRTVFFEQSNKKWIVLYN